MRLRLPDVTAGASFVERESRLVGDVRPPLDVVLREESSYVTPQKEAVDVGELFADYHVSLVDAFKEFDEDGSGSITRGELKSGLQGLAAKGLIREVSDKQFRELVGKLDKDGNGNIGASSAKLVSRTHWFRWAVIGSPVPPLSASV